MVLIEGVQRVGGGGRRDRVASGETMRGSVISVVTMEKVPGQARSPQRGGGLLLEPTTARRELSADGRDSDFVERLLRSDTEVIEEDLEGLWDVCPGPGPDEVVAERRQAGPFDAGLAENHLVSPFCAIGAVEDLE